MLEPKDLLPQPPWEGPPIPRAFTWEENMYRSFYKVITLTPLGVITYHRELNPNRVTIAKFWGR